MSRCRRCTRPRSEVRSKKPVIKKETDVHGGFEGEVVGSLEPCMSLRAGTKADRVRGLHLCPMQASSSRIGERATARGMRFASAASQAPPANSNGVRPKKRSSVP